MSLLTQTRCPKNDESAAAENCYSNDLNSAGDEIVEDVDDVGLKKAEFGVPKFFLPFLLGSPKLAECRVCEKVINPGEEVPCNIHGCTVSYHFECASDRFGISSSTKIFKCPQHACFLCKKKSHLWRCSKCDLASHDKCAAFPEYVLRSHERPGQIVCWRHSTDWPPVKPAVPTNSIEEVFSRLAVPYVETEIKIHPEPVFVDWGAKRIRKFVTGGGN